MKSTIKILVLIITVFTITSCDRFYDSVISFADMNVEELLEDVTDEDLIEHCSDEEYTNGLKITKTECSDLVISRKELCFGNIQEKWKNNISKKSDIEDITTEYIECLMKIK